MQFEDLYKGQDCKIWTFQQTRDYHLMTHQSRKLDQDAHPSPFQFCYDAFSNFSNIGISTGGSYLQPLFYNTTYSHMAETLLIHGFCKSNMYQRIANAFTRDFKRMSNGIKVYNNLTQKWEICVPFLVFALGDTPQRADFCCHCHHNSEQGCPYCNCSKTEWVVRSSIMRKDIPIKIVDQKKKDEQQKKQQQQ
jgi:hypothetical protein